MNKRRDHQAGAALGLYGSAGAWTLVRIERADDGWRVASKKTVTRANGSDGRAEIQQLFPQPGPEDRGLPLGVALSDHAGMYRRIAAPRADDAVLAKVVAAQVETMLPGGADRVYYGWSRARGGQALWIHALHKPTAEAVLSLLPEQANTAAILSDTMAVTRAVTTDSRARQEAVLILLVGANQSSLSLITDGELDGVRAIDCGPGHAQWLGHIRDAQDELLGPVAPERRPTRCYMVGPADMGSHTPQIDDADIGMPLAAWSGGGDISGLDANDTSSLIAAHAAASCFDPTVPATRLAARVDGGGIDLRLRKYAAVAAVWLLIALAALYLSDRYRASRVGAMLLDGALDDKRLQDLQRQTDVARYLEMSGPVPLAIIDEVGQATEGFMFDDLSFERGGVVRIGGKLKSAEEIGKLTESLSQTRTLKGVQLQSQTAEGDQVRFDITADSSPNYFGAFVEPPPDKKETKEEKPG